MTEDPDFTGGLIEFRCIHASGHPVWIESSATPIYDENAKVTGILTVFRDITERRQIEALRRERDVLQAVLHKEQELSSLKSTMMVRIEHEFRTPLATIHTSAELLTRYLERMTAAQREDRFETIRGQIAHLTSMLDGIRGVIDTARGATEPVLSPVDVTALCRDLIAQMNGLRSQPIAFASTADSVAILSDEGLLGLALRQVLLNAVRYSHHDSPLTVELLTAPDAVTIRVIDAGISIIPDELPRVFEPFFRGSNINEVGGLGIGLTLARAAINALNGSITILSEVGRGTTVTIHLPVVTPSRPDGAK